MSRRLARLTLDHLDALDAPCRSCLFWELDPVRRTRIAACDAAGEKQAWLSEVLRDWGSCGRVALVEQRPVGLIVYAPPRYLPGAQGFATSPVSADAVLMATVHVAEPYDRMGLGRVLVQAMASDLIERGGIRAVEAFGGLTPPCTVPTDFLSSVGFKTQRAHPRAPRMRMDLRSTVTWRPEAALERLFGKVRPLPAPVNPVGRVSHDGSTGP